MKTAVQLAASLLAAAGLLVGAASHATNLSELPLKASVLAKPNVVFGMDDSGSMDWEVLLSTDSGLAYWNGSSSFSSGKPLESSSYTAYGYLFPVGTATGGSIYSYNSGYGQAAPPTTQFAWLRSPKFNPLYYNTNTTYAPWAPAYVSGSYVSSYPAATASAAKAHPATSSTPTLALSSQWDSSNGSYTSNGYRFYMQAGMTVPSGATLNTSGTGSSGTPCSGSTSRTTTADQTVPNNSACWVSIPYYPATFWNAEDCTVNGSTCINAGDGSTKLKRYEIKSGNTFPSGRSYADELQNFANWFTYHRKRKLMLAAAMGHSLENITGLRLAVMPFGSSPTLTMADADSTTNSSNRFSISGQFYLNAMSGNGTPTHATMKRIGGQFDTNTNIIQYACQRNSMFVVTDGFANANSETAPSYTSSTYGGTAPYTTTTANSLADFALAYYTNRLRTDLTAGKVPPGSSTATNPDLNTNLHVTTYAITLGARGTLYPNAANPFATNVFTTPPTWPTPLADDPTALDDLWHATVNGRGQMYMANDSDALRLAIQSALSDILSQAGAQGGVAVSAVNLDRSDSQAYLGVYNPSGWSGDLTANPINTATAAVSTTPNWAAASLLAARPWSNRIIFSASGTSGVDFSVSNVGATVNPDTSSFTNTQVVEYLRGNRSGEGTLFRPRTSLIGAVVNAEPVLAREERTVYLASGDGMLHAFDTLDGSEQWAFAPPDQLANIGKSAVRGWVYNTLLDASPTYAKLSTGTKLLVGGLGAAGRSYYALDVSSPRGLDSTQAAAQFKWIFPATSDTTTRAKMGYTVGKPIIAKTAADGDVVLVTSGYDNGQTIGDGKGRLWMLNAATGAVIKTFRTTAGSTGAESGLAYVAAFKESDGTARYVYGGDLLGNVWKFDLTSSGSGEIDGTLLAVLKDGSGNTQPVTAIPELAMISNKRVVLVGTGRVLDITDFGSSRTQSFYAIADGATLSNARSSLVAQTYNASNDTITANTVNWATGRGWYFDLPAGQQANTDPVVAYGAVAFVTNVNGSTDCSQSSYMYLLDIGTGTKVAGSTFVGQTISTTATSSRVIALRVISGKIVGTTHRSDNSVYQRELPLGTTINPAKNAWREVRR
jgi:type IV pilus assembly protein PilY1